LADSLPIPPFWVPDLFLAAVAASSAIDPGTRLCSAASATGSAEQRGHARIYNILYIGRQSANSPVWGDCALF